MKRSYEFEGFLSCDKETVLGQISGREEELGKDQERVCDF